MLEIFINEIYTSEGKNNWEEVYHTEEDLEEGVKNFIEVLKVLQSKRRIQKRIYVPKVSVLEFIEYAQEMLFSSLKQDIQEEIKNLLFNQLNAKNWKGIKNTSDYLYPNLRTYQLEFIDNDSILAGIAQKKEQNPEQLLLLINFYNDEYFADKTKVQLLRTSLNNVENLVEIDCSDNAKDLIFWFRKNFKPQNAKELIEAYQDNFNFEPQAEKDLIFWEKNTGIFERIIDLLDSIIMNPFEGIGKPEGLKNNLQGFWSRHIDDGERLIYKVNDKIHDLKSCKGHYGDK